MVGDAVFMPELMFGPAFWVQPTTEAPWAGVASRARRIEAGRGRHWVSMRVVFGVMLRLGSKIMMGGSDIEILVRIAAIGGPVRRGEPRGSPHRILSSPPLINQTQKLQHPDC